MSYRWDDFLLDVEPYCVERGIITPPVPAHVSMQYREWSPPRGVIVFERGELRGNIRKLTLSPSP